MDLEEKYKDINGTYSKILGNSDELKVINLLGGIEGYKGNKRE